MNMKPPRKKKNSHRTYGLHPPLPIFVKTPNGTYTDDSLTPVFKGYYSGYYVVVDNEDDARTLYNMGFFGKGSLSRSFPCFGRRINGMPPVVQETQWKRRRMWIEKLQKAFDLCNLTDQQSSTMDTVEETSATSDNPTDKERLIKMVVDYESKENQILVISDLNVNCPDLNPRLETELVETVVEVGRLSLEEAFFLSYGLGCLEIVNLVSLLSPIESWTLFKTVQKDFIESYVAYHHYRAKGWVVKTGLKYGGNYLLYNKGPAFFHASYVVVIKNIGKPGSEEKDGLSWDLTFLNRIAEQSNKEVIICHVQWPSLDSNEYNTPEVLRRFRVKDSILERWNPSATASSNEIDL